MASDNSTDPTGGKKRVKLFGGFNFGSVYNQGGNQQLAATNSESLVEENDLGMADGPGLHREISHTERLDGGRGEGMPHPSVAPCPIVSIPPTPQITWDYYDSCSIYSTEYPIGDNIISIDPSLFVFEESMEQGINLEEEQWEANTQATDFDQEPL